MAAMAAHQATAAQGAGGNEVVIEELETLGSFGERVLTRLVAWADANILSISTTYQLAALALALVLATLAHRGFGRLLGQLATKGRGVGLIDRVLRTLASISFAVLWVLLLWIGTVVLEATGQPYALLRLVASLINAWIIIRVATIFIPSAYWASVFAWCAWSVAALNAVGLLGPAIAVLDETAFSVGEVRLSLWTVVKAALLTALLLWLAYAASGLIERRFQRARALDTSMRVLLAKLLRFFLIVVAVVTGLSAVGIDLTAFAIFSGALGVGIGLGLQRTVANLVAGFALLADRSLKPGDVIEIETGQGPTYGIVRKMTSRYVAVETRDGTETLIPNELLIANPVTNWSYSHKRVRRRLAIGVSYESDVELAMELCVRAAVETPRVIREPKPVCQLRAFGESSIDLELRIWIEDPEEGIANVASAVYVRIWKLFREHGIEVPFAQRDLHLRSAVPLEVRVAPTPQAGARKGRGAG